MTWPKILGRLTSGDRTVKGSQPSVTNGSRIYAIGDIHGRADLLAKLHEQIKRDAADDSPDLVKTIVYLGDYVDRGLDSKGVIDLVLNNPLDGFEKIHLKGNHEDAMLQFLDDVSVGPAWFSIGGDATALSYGVRVPPRLPSEQRFEYVRRGLRDQIPDEHMKFLGGLKLTFEAGDYFFVHAGIRPGTPIYHQEPRDLMWIRDTFLGSNENHGRMIVHGHSPTRSPDIRTHRIGIDTGAFATNVLTCLVLEGTRRWFLATGKD